MVELRFFLGFTSEETAELLNTSKATVDRELRFVRGWLYDRLHPDRLNSDRVNPVRPQKDLPSAS